MQKYPEITQSVIPWANVYFPSSSCAACGSVLPSNLKHFHKLFLHLQTCSVYTENEREIGLNEWDAAYNNKPYLPRPVLRKGIPISMCKHTREHIMGSSAYPIHSENGHVGDDEETHKELTE